MVARRMFIKTASLAVLVASTSRSCHHHIYDAARFPVRAGSRVIPNARVEDYRLLQRRIGTSRNIVVTPIGFPATFAENLVTLDAIKQASGNARGIAIINPTISTADLQTLHDGGVRGIRYSSTGGSVPAAIAKEIEPLAKRVADLGWHVQINIEAGPILELEDLWNRQMGRMRGTSGKAGNTSRHNRLREFYRKLRSRFNPPPTLTTKTCCPLN